MQSQIDGKELDIYKEACQYLGEPETLPNTEGIPDDQAKYILAVFIWQKVLKARNRRANSDKAYWPNWYNQAEWKYRPYVEVNASAEHPAGSGFSYSSCGRTDSGTHVGSRLSAISSDVIMDMINDLPETFKTMMLG